LSKFLTAEWLEDCRLRWSVGPPGPDATVAFIITGGPADEGRADGYWWRLEDGRLADAGLGTPEAAEVVLTHSHADAVSVARGESDLNAGFMQGRVKVAGDSAQLFSVLALTASPAYRRMVGDLAAGTDFA
jgi:hypothetical protein